MGFLGIAAFLAVCYIFPSSKKNIKLPVVLWGLPLQFILVVLILGIPKWGIPGVLKPVFTALAFGINKMLAFSMEGTKFLFGGLLDKEKFGFVIILDVFPVIIFFSAVMAILYHWGIMQKVVRGLGFVMQKTMKVSGAESVAAAANIFVGQTEAPLIVRPYLAKMTRSELLCLMVGGLATTAGSILAAYVGVLNNIIPNVAEHLITASVMSAPAALLVSKILIPETEVPETVKFKDMKMESNSCNFLDAMATGTREGMFLAFNVAAMLLAFIAMVALLNSVLSGFGDMIGFSTWGASLIPGSMQPELSLQFIFSWLCAPFAFLMGIPWSECLMAGVLLGGTMAAFITAAIISVFI